MTKHGKLYIVALPIGNSEDITLRAIKCLQECNVVAAEDTRTFSDLCKRLQINAKKIIAYHDHNESDSAQGILSLLKEGSSVAVVSDAGTPGIADPGFRILQLCYENGISVEPIPGVSSLTAALSVCPIGGASHYFGGFFPTKSNDRHHMFQKIKSMGSRSIFFEAPHRILEHLDEAQKALGDISIFIAREITKNYQEYNYKKISEWIERFRSDSPKGEFVVAYPELTAEKMSKTNVETAIVTHLRSGRSSKEILDILKEESGMPRGELYDLIQDIKSRIK